jgi:hypothetical protein
MENLYSRSEEKSLEEAQETGRKHEPDLQLGREEAKENGIKQGREEGRSQENRRRGPGTGVKLILCLIVFVIIGTIIAFLSLSVSVTDISSGNSLPYTTKYGVSFPEGQQLTIGNTHITVLSYQNELISDIDGNKQKLVVGTNREIAERRAVITTFGSIILMDTIFKIELNYSGDRDNRAYFDMAVHTSKQVPDMLIKRLIPPEIDAKPT